MAQAAADEGSFPVSDLVAELRAEAPALPVDRFAPLAGLSDLSARAGRDAMAASQKLHAERWRRDALAERNDAEDIAERAERARERKAVEEDRQRAQEDREQAAADRRRADFQSAQERRHAEQDRRVAAADRATAKKRARWTLVGVIAGIIGSAAGVVGLLVTLNRDPAPVIVPAPVVTVLPPAPASPTLPPGEASPAPQQSAEPAQPTP